MNTTESTDKIIPFYGADEPDLFEIERRCMDRDGRVLAHLVKHLPRGLILDVGAGNGFVARHLDEAGRSVIPCEPNPGMIAEDRSLPWVRGAAQDLPFADGVFAAAYATWAFFLDGVPGVDDGLAELARVVPGGSLIIVDNAGGDEFCSLAPRPIASNRDFWLQRGFSETIVNTSWRFDDSKEARFLLERFFGPVQIPPGKKDFTYRVAAYAKVLSLTEQKE